MPESAGNVRFRRRRGGSSAGRARVGSGKWRHFDGVANGRRVASAGVGMLLMKTRRVLNAGAFLMFALTTPESTNKHAAPPQMELKTYALYGGPNAADLSPDERVAATEITRRVTANDPETKDVEEIVELWDFKSDKMTAEVRLMTTNVREKTKGYVPDPNRSNRVVRFSPDGTKVVALVASRIFVLDATKVDVVREIALETSGNASPPHEPLFRTMEISPDGEKIAVATMVGDLRGRIDIYSLDSGKRVEGWEVSEGWAGLGSSPVWSTDSKTIVVAAPGTSPCGAPNGLPDIFAFDSETGTITGRWTSGMLVGSVAASGDGRLFAVDRNCLGVFRNHDPKLKVIDVATGNIRDEISGRGDGVRYMVALSGDGKRLLAFTGKIEMQFDWGDAVPRDRVVDETFSVWDSKSYAGLATSQNIPGLMRATVRLSSHGRYTIVCGRANAAVYELP